MTDTTPAEAEATEADAPEVSDNTPEVTETEQTGVPDESGTDEPETDSGNAEAARYRRKLREAESERDALSQRLEAMQRAEAERLAGQDLAKGAAIWAAGTELTALLAEDGTVDAALVKAAALTAREQLGLQPPPRGGYVRSEGANPSTGGTTKQSMVDAVMGSNG